jgi:hypothetical protein
MQKTIDDNGLSYLRQATSTNNSDNIGYTCNDSTAYWIISWTSTEPRMNRINRRRWNKELHKTARDIISQAKNWEHIQLSSNTCQLKLVNKNYKFVRPFRGPWRMGKCNNWRVSYAD